MKIIKLDQLCTVEREGKYGPETDVVHDPIYIVAEHIESFYYVGNTAIKMVSGETIKVKESPEELIASLESAGELSIRDQKFLRLAKAYQQLAAENVGLKESVEHAAGCIAAAEAEGLIDALAETTDGRLADLVHRRLCHAYLEVETPATDRIVAEAEARGVERAIVHLEKKFSNIGVQIMNLQWLADSLREGADK